MPIKSPYPDLAVPDKSFHDVIFCNLLRCGKEVALIDNTHGKSMTFSEIHCQSRRLAAALFPRGLKKGDVVAICAPSCVEYAIVWLAASSCGAALTTCNPDYTEGEIALQFRQAKPVMVFTHINSLERIKNVAEEIGEIKHVFTLEEISGFQSIDQLIEGVKEEDFPSSVLINPGEDVLLMPYSSGTTGLPKCVMHSHTTFLASMNIILTHHHIFRCSNFYCERPMFHAGGLFCLAMALLSGCKVVFDANSEAEIMASAIEKYKITHTLLVPPIMIALSNNDLHQKYDLSSLKVAYCGGASVSSALMVELGKKLNIIIQQAYGMTECSISVSDPIVDCPDSTGFVVSNTSVKIVDLVSGEELGENQSGEILVNGPQRMIGYYQNPEPTAQAIDKDGWLHTGDIGYCNKDGMLFMTGRSKEVIKYRTFQIPPAELEEVLLKHPGIADVGVIGISDPEAGEVPRALVVRKDVSLTEDDVMKHVSGELTDYKHLRGGVQFVDSIPKSVLGKILRQELKNLVKME